MTVDPVKRLEVYKQLQRILLQDVPWVPLASSLSVNLNQPAIQDVYYDKYATLLIHDTFRAR